MREMLYREYGKTGIVVSVLGFGTGRFPIAKRDFDMDRIVNILRRAFDLGVNYVDTAEAYSLNRGEVAVGRAIKGQRDQVYVSTKVSRVCTSGDEWRAYFDGCLQRLDTDYVDFYHHHNLQWKNYQKQLGPDGPIERCRQAAQEGLIHHMCFSSHDTPENIVRLIDTGEFDGMLVQYNVVDRSNEEVIAYAHERGMGVSIMGPVGGGLLTAPLEQIRRAVGDAKSTPEVALRFVLSNPNVTLALSGMNTVEMVEENVAAASRSEALSDAEIQGVLGALQEIQRLADLYCTGCGYCMPCPNGVDIPANLQAMNYYRIWGWEEHARDLYRRLGFKRQWHGRKVQRWAEACVECGECEPKCPQHIAIREQLKETAVVLGHN
jgi:predicted aldo/keto reductase-like oxidoreductase